jgi:3-oxoacyl-[acyl-carrier protein] reductase
MAQHLGPRGVRANVLLPGAIETAMTREAFSTDYRDQAIAHTPIGRIGAPDEVARAALFLASDEATFVTGAVLAVDGGWLVAP